MPPQSGPGRPSGPTVLNQGAGVPVTRGSAFGPNFLALNRTARDHDGSIPMMPGQIAMTAHMTCAHAAGPLGSRIKLQAW